MEIKDLQAGQGSVNIQVTVKSVEEPKTFNKYGKELRLVNAVVTDGTDEIKLTLWNEDVDKVKVGSIIKVTNGYVNEFQGEKSLTSGKFGKLEFLDGSEESSAEATDESAEQTPSTEETAPVTETPVETPTEKPSEEEVGDY